MWCIFLNMHLLSCKVWALVARILSVTLTARGAVAKSTLYLKMSHRIVSYTVSRTVTKRVWSKKKKLDFFFIT